MSGASMPGAPPCTMETDDGVEEDLYIGDGEFLDGEDEDINFVNDGSGLDEATKQFDRIVGALEDVLMDPDLEDARESFCKKNCIHFEDNDENKLIYTDLFSKYTEMVEAVIEARLKAAVPGFDMMDFMQMLDERREELMGDVFELLVSLGDFEAFKEVMLSYKKEAQQGGSGFSIQCKALKIYTEEQEDGEVREDLDLALQISPMGGGPSRTVPRPY